MAQHNPEHPSVRSFHVMSHRPGSKPQNRNNSEYLKFSEFYTKDGLHGYRLVEKLNKTRHVEVPRCQWQQKAPLLPEGGRPGRRRKAAGRRSPSQPGRNPVQDQWTQTQSGRERVWFPTLPPPGPQWPQNLGHAGHGHPPHSTGQSVSQPGMKYRPGGWSFPNTHNRIVVPTLRTRLLKLLTS